MKNSYTLHWQHNPFISVACHGYHSYSQQEEIHIIQFNTHRNANIKSNPIIAHNIEFTCHVNLLYPASPSPVWIWSGTVSPTPTLTFGLVCAQYDRR